MVILLWVFLALIGVVMVAVVAVLALPLRLAVRAVTGPEARFVFSVQVLGGLVPRIRVVDTDRPRKPGKPDKPTRKAKRKHRKRGKGLSGDTIRRMLLEAPELISAEFQRIHIDRFRLTADFGLGDPAATGELYGWMCPLVYATPLNQADITLRPVFTEARFAADLDAAVRFTPVSLVVPVVRAAWRVFVVKP